MALEISWKASEVRLLSGNHNALLHHVSGHSEFSRCAVGHFVECASGRREQLRGKKSKQFSFTCFYALEILQKTEMKQYNKLFFLKHCKITTILHDQRDFGLLLIMTVKITTLNSYGLVSFQQDLSLEAQSSAVVAQRTS